jgi:hypothetical protein
MALPTEAKARKEFPLATGLLDYFPDALVEVAGVSYIGNEQHNPGTPLHWDRSKSQDEADALMRHFLERGTLDGDGVRHTAKVAWRALALLQKEIEGDRNFGPLATMSADEREEAETCYRPSYANGQTSDHVANRIDDRCVGCGVTRAQVAALGHRFVDE